MQIPSETIAAIATGVGGAIAVIRVSGSLSIAICDKIFRSASGVKLSESKGYTLHYGTIQTKFGVLLDDVIVSLFRGPKSYTGEDMVEISCHGSNYIKREILRLVVENGGRLADAGEFTIRAFLAGKMDLSQAEAVADMIASTDRASHAMAASQIRGGYSQEFVQLRGELVRLISLVELELDFGEEQVEFADRGELMALVRHIATHISSLASSFSLGNAIKEGVAVAIVGSPNVGKSTLLNAMLNDQRAMVSEIAGTTRDSIEESIDIGGIKFRFIDTAGIRETVDLLEKMGIERTHETISRAKIILLLVEATPHNAMLVQHIRGTLETMKLRDDQRLYIVVNKIDRLPHSEAIELVTALKHETCSYGVVNTIAISAKLKQNIDELLKMLSDSIDTEPIYNGASVVSNIRHWQALCSASESLSMASEGIESGLSGDLLSQHIRQTLHHLGLITGEVTTDDILGEIFSKFCIGK